MKTSFRRRLLPVLIAAALLVAVASLPVSAQSRKAGFPASVSASLDPSDVPAAVGYEAALAKGHTERLFAEEPDLYTVIFRNADGTKTMYLFDDPVKYEAKDGTIRDVVLTVAESNGAVYEAAENRFRIEFAKNGAGASLREDGLALSLSPADAEARNAAGNRTEKGTVEYPFGAYTAVEYAPDYSGFTQTVTVSEYTGQTEYSFRLLTNGLTPVAKDGSVLLTDENGTLRARVTDALLRTADDRSNRICPLAIRTVRENQEYLLTVSPDEEWLSAPTTAYPLRMEAALVIEYEISGAGAIQDVTINSNTDSDGGSGTLSVGKRRAEFGLSRILMKFPGLELGKIGSAAEVFDAVLEFEDLIPCETEMTVYCHVFTGNEWDQDTTEWKTVDAENYGALLSKNVVSFERGELQTTAHRYRFDFTEAVKGWKTGNYDPDKGILFKLSAEMEAREDAPEKPDETDLNRLYKMFGSYERVGHKPTVSVTYSDRRSGALADGTRYYFRNLTGGVLARGKGGVYTAPEITLHDDSARWVVKNTDRGYVLQSAEDRSKYLAVPKNRAAFGLTFAIVRDAPIPAECLWSVLPAAGEGVLLRSNHNGAYLCAGARSVRTVSGPEFLLGYGLCVWQVTAADPLPVPVPRNTPLERVVQSVLDSMLRFRIPFLTRK